MGKSNILQKCFIVFIGFIMIGCVNLSSSESSVENDLLNKLSSINGKFIWNKSQKQFFFNKRDEIEKIIAGKNVEETLQLLVENIDNQRLSISTINGKKVMLGAVCYVALTQIAYYEAVTKDGDIAKGWTGYVSPDANIEDLSEAKKEWQKVMESHSYILL